MEKTIKIIFYIDNNSLDLKPFIYEKENFNKTFESFTLQEHMIYNSNISEDDKIIMIKNLKINHYFNLLSSGCNYLQIKNEINKGINTLKSNMSSSNEILIMEREKYILCQAYSLYNELFKNKSKL